MWWDTLWSKLGKRITLHEACLLQWETKSKATGSHCVVNKKVKGAWAVWWGSMKMVPKMQREGNQSCWRDWSVCDSSPLCIVTSKRQSVQLGRQRLNGGAFLSLGKPAQGTCCSCGLHSCCLSAALFCRAAAGPTSCVPTGSAGHTLSWVMHTVQGVQDRAWRHGGDQEGSSLVLFFQPPLHLSSLSRYPPSGWLQMWK